MEGAKLLDMIPERLREAFIEEVEELLAERNTKGKPTNKKVSDKEIEDSIKAWAKGNADQSRKAIEI